MLLVSIVGSSAASAATYYVDAIGGNDSNHGQSEAAPWKSLEKVRVSSFPSGSTIYLKRGVRWNESLVIPSSGLTIDAYGTGELPKLDSSVPVGGWTVPFLAGAGIYGTSAISLAPIGVGALGNLSEDGVLMPMAAWTGSVGGSLGPAPYGSYTYDHSARRIYIKVAADPNQSGKTYLASTLLYGVLASKVSDVTVQNLHLTRFSMNGVDYSDCLRCSVRNLTVTDGGGAVVVLPNIYAGNGVQWSGSSAYGIADGITVRNVFDSGISPQTFAGGSVIHDIQIRNSDIDRVGFAGVEISLLSFGQGSSISAISVSDSRITNTGHGWGGNRYGENAHGVRVGDDPAAGLISDVSVQRTSITNSVGNAIDVFGEIGTLTLDRLRLTGNQMGVYARAPFGQGLTLKVALTASIIDSNRGDGFLYLTPSGPGFSLLHNTFFRNGSTNVHVSGQSGEARIVNNVFAGDSAMTQLNVDNLTNNNSRILYGAKVDHNCYSPSSTMIFYGNVLRPTLKSFQDATGFELSGVQGIIAASGDATGLGLASPASGNFVLNDGSPCRGSGSSITGIELDYFGQPFARSPSIGAVEVATVPGGDDSGGGGEPLPPDDGGGVVPDPDGGGDGSTDTPPADNPTVPPGTPQDPAAGSFGWSALVGLALAALLRRRARAAESTKP